MKCKNCGLKTEIHHANDSECLAAMKDVFKQIKEEREKISAIKQYMERINELIGEIIDQ